MFTNVLNHAQLLDPVGLAVGSPGSFGNLPGEGNGTTPVPDTPRLYGVRIPRSLLSNREVPLEWHLPQSKGRA